MSRPGIAIIAFMMATAVVHGLIAWWTPVHGEDWAHWVWAGQHAEKSGLAWLFAFASSHFTFADAASYVLARVHIVHVVFTPIAVVALVIGIFTISIGRTPRATWDDALLVALASACLWIAQPRGGITLFHTPNVARFVYGTAAALWLVAPLRCGWRPSRTLWPVLSVLGYCVGTSSLAIATATLVGFVLALRTGARARWVWFAFGGLVVGTIVGYIDPPWIEFPKVFRRGLEPNLVLFTMPLEEAGELIALVAALVLANVIAGALGARAAGQEHAPDPRTIYRWLLAWFATAVWCLFGPRYGAATLLPATVMVVIAALPVLRWLASGTLLLYGLVALAVGTHLVVWIFALSTYRSLGTQGGDRLVAFESTPRGEVAVVPPYAEITPTFWWPGEDMGQAGPRQLVAMAAFDLRDIELSPRYRRYEINPQVGVELETEGVSASELAAASPPEIWAGELSVLRRQFAQLMRKLRDTTGKNFRARLRVVDVEFPERASRPLLAAWFDDSELMTPRVSRGAAQQYSRYTIRIYPPHASRFTEAWSVIDGDARKLELSGGSVMLQPMNAGLHVVLLCDAQRCLVADAFTPRF